MEIKKIKGHWNGEVTGDLARAASCESRHGSRIYVCLRRDERRV